MNQKLFVGGANPTCGFLFKYNQRPKAHIFEYIMIEYRKCHVFAKYGSAKKNERIR